MAIDQDLAERVRSLLRDELTSEKYMFGGLAFLIAGRMAVAVGDDGLLIRVDPEAEWITGDPRASDAMSGRAMRNWRSFSIIADSTELVGLIAHSVEQAKTLPPKK